ncbi:MAG: protein-arginine deiminase family protein, partial [Spirulina sp.]
MKKSKSTNRLSDLEQNLSSDRPLPPPPPDPSPSGSGGLFKLDKAHQKANQLSQAQQAPQQTHYKARSFDDNQPIEMVTEDRDNDSSMVARVFDTDEPITVQNQDYDQDYAEASSLNEMGTGEVPFQAASFEAEEDISPAREPDPRAFSHSSELGATLEEIRDEVQQLKWEQKQSPEQTEAIADQMAAISEELRSLRQQRIHQEGKLASDALQKGGTRDRHQGGGRHDRYQGGGKRDRSSQEVKPLSHDYWETLELEPTFDKFDRQMSEPEDSQYAPVDVVSPQAMEMDLSEQFDLFDRMMEVEERSERSASREFSEDLATGNGNYVEQFGLEEVNPTLNNYLKGKREHKENKNPYLNMYLDLDRDGKIERDTPANYNQWTPGKGKVGAIIMARPDRGVLNSMIMGKNEVKRGTPVEERYPLLFEWGGGGYKLDEHQGWTATLTVEPSDKIRVYLEDIDSKIQGNQEGATQILGTDSESKNQFVLHKNKEVYKSLEKHSAILMWMEATDYPDDDFDGLIRLTFEFSFKATKYTHKAILQVAPWIMASDLDPTYFVYAGRKHQDTELGVGDALEPIVTKAGVGFKLLKEQKKTFARDPMKAGYVLSPFYSGITILCDLDQGSPYRTLPASVYQNLVKEGIATQLIRKPKNIQETNDRFDGGGNYLVSPPSAKYPFGRIIYGAGTHVEKFIKAQNIQNPIEVNSGWLDVGHVDEFLSFIPNRKLLKSDTESPWPYKILIASPRLGYILSYIASAAKAVTNKEGSARNYGSRKMWEDANEIDRQIRQQVIQLKQDSSSSE